jgi:hypothetical protein
MYVEAPKGSGVEWFFLEVGPKSSAQPTLLLLHGRIKQTEREREEPRDALVRVRVARRAARAGRRRPPRHRLGQLHHAAGGLYRIGK